MKEEPPTYFCLMTFLSVYANKRSRKVLSSNHALPYFLSMQSVVSFSSILKQNISAYFDSLGGIQLSFLITTPPKKLWVSLKGSLSSTQLCIQIILSHTKDLAARKRKDMKAHLEFLSDLRTIWKGCSVDLHQVLYLLFIGM
jgi:hypothetical protein